MSRVDTRSLLDLSVQKLWILQRALLIDYSVVAIVAIPFLGLDSHRGFALIGTLLACSLGARIGGDETIAGTWEFTLTRPMERSRWFTARFLSGLLPLGLLLILVVTSDRLGLSARVWGLLVDRLPGATDSIGVELGRYAVPASFVLLVYAFSFRFAIGERVAANVLSHRASGVLFAGFALLFIALAAALLHYFVPSLPLPNYSADDPEQIGPVALPLVAMAFIVSLSTRAAVVRREEVGDGSSGAGGSGSTSMRGGVITLVVAIIACVVLAVMWYSASRVTPVAENSPPSVETPEGGR